jgi:putative PIN family toxin of toxin-antitoxin system
MKGHPDMKNRRVIIDTNLWISFLITHDFLELDDLLFDHKIKLLFSEELLEEFIAVTKRPKFEKYFSSSDIYEVMKLIEAFSEFIIVKSNITLCRDEKDNFLLNLAIDGKAGFLVTGDKDLLDIGQVFNTKILSWTRFRSEIKELT